MDWRESGDTLLNPLEKEMELKLWGEPLSDGSSMCQAVELRGPLPLTHYSWVP